MPFLTMIPTNASHLLFDSLDLGAEAFALSAGPAGRQLGSQRRSGRERVLGAAVRLEQEAGQVLAQRRRLLSAENGVVRVGSLKLKHDTVSNTVRTLFKIISNQCSFGFKFTHRDSGMAKLYS